ncbi:MAG TPA: methyltransferase domain-containing protein [Steroidobacteraceae bacterium]
MSDAHFDGLDEKLRLPIMPAARPPAVEPVGYHIMQVRPPGYAHADALTELAQATCHGLRRLGAPASLNAPPRAGDRQIVFGSHLLDAQAAAVLPPDAIIYNTEQMTDESPWLGSTYLNLLRTHRVWDYSEQNVLRLRELGVGDAHYVPVGFVPQLVRIAPALEDIDVLFYGSLNPRRQHVLDELAQRGLKVVHLFGKYGAERDHAIARAKVVLSIHFYESKIFEVVRVSYLLSNFKAVVAECGPDTEVEPDLRGAVRGVPYAELADACVALVGDGMERRALGERGYNVFAARRAENILANALGLPGPPSAPSAVPRMLNVGSGKDYRPDHLNIDINCAWGPDAVLDLASAALIGSQVKTQRFGAVTIQEDYFDTLVANDVLEHILDLTGAMSNALRLLRPGGMFQIAVPYDLGLGAWQDPTHVRAFNENSWLYYTDWHWYLGWTDARFDTVKLEFQPTAFGSELVQASKPLAEILRTPRAVDSMRVVLRKRYLQDSERREAEARQPGTQRP